MNKLREARKIKGLTLKEVAEDTGILENLIGKYEREEREPKKETWIKLADYYCVPVAYLMGLPDGLVQHINKTQTMTIDDVKSNRLRELRKKLGFTVKQVSEDMKECGIDIPVSTLTKYEVGERNPKIDKLKDLAFYYKVPLSYLQGEPMNFEELHEAIIQWAEDRNMIKKDRLTVLAQFAKVSEEQGELSAGINKNDREKIEDSLGDILVTLIILSRDLNVDLLDCLRGAYGVIKDRTGKTINGVFVKESDLHE
ncbi:MAG: helix-turn-helix domain-containing protein [Ligilactobacillus salivarius]|nr:helix-turn-helix domain-containing protein [Ligilactobacillus salivarius]